MDICEVVAKATRDGPAIKAADGAAAAASATNVARALLLIMVESCLLDRRRARKISSVGCLVPFLISFSIHITNFGLSNFDGRGTCDDVLYSRKGSLVERSKITSNRLNSDASARCLASSAKRYNSQMAWETGEQRRECSTVVPRREGTVGIYPLKGGRHEDACPMVDLLSKGRWRSTA
jgi:hypothetical protein